MVPSFSQLRDDACLPDPNVHLVHETCPCQPDALTLHAHCELTLHAHCAGSIAAPSSHDIMPRSALFFSATPRAGRA
jgi:hypothetical protein